MRELAPLPQEESVAIADGMGRVVAYPVFAMADHPRFDCSAMDGFAIPRLLAGANTFPADLRIGAQIRAGGALPQVSSRAAIPISTGAPVPHGYDAVITRERASVFEAPAGAFLRVPEAPVPGSNVRRRGEDGKRGDEIVAANAILSAEAVGALAAFGVAKVSVFKSPRLALLRTGDEVAYAGNSPRGSQIFDVNGPMIIAMAKREGLALDAAGLVPDEDAKIAEAFAQFDAGNADIMISTGGVSAGDHDQVPDVLRGLGAKVHFHGVRMRPGKPLLFASLPSGKLVFGLPGNPVAAATAFRFFVMAAIQRMTQRPPETGVEVSLDVEGRSGTTIILKGRSVSPRGAALTVELLKGQQSHRMRPLLEADHWVVVETGLQGTTTARAFAMAPDR